MAMLSSGLCYCRSEGYFKIILADICSRNIFYLLCNDIATVAEVLNVGQELNWPNEGLEWQAFGNIKVFTKTADVEEDPVL